MKNKNPKTYWFKRRRYGWGWIPVSWQGWLSVIAVVLFIIAGALTLTGIPKNQFTREVGFYLIFVAVLVLQLIILGYKKGPKPKWRWGKNTDDNPEEDY